MNPRHSGPQPDALPTELPPPMREIVPQITDVRKPSGVLVKVRHNMADGVVKPHGGQLFLGVANPRKLMTGLRAGKIDKDFVWPVLDRHSYPKMTVVQA